MTNEGEPMTEQSNLRITQTGPSEFTVRRSALDRAIWIALIGVMAAYLTVQVAMFVQRLSHPTVVYYCTASDCATPEKFWKDHRVEETR